MVVARHPRRFHAARSGFTQSLAIDPGWFLFAAVLLLLVYRGALTGQVPLYLSNKQTVQALADLMAARGDTRFLDLGAGVGSTTVPLADALPDSHFTGYENAPLTWLVGLLLSVGRPNIRWRWDDLWQAHLGNYDVVYAFLSPAPMPQLWEKVQAEMKPGSLFISNSFPVPGATPDQHHRSGLHPAASALLLPALDLAWHPASPKPWP